MFAPNYMNMQPMNGYGFNNITNNYGGYPFGYPPQIVNSGYNMYQQSLCLEVVLVLRCMLPLRN